MSWSWYVVSRILQILILGDYSLRLGWTQTFLDPTACRKKRLKKLQVDLITWVKRVVLTEFPHAGIMPKFEKWAARFAPSARDADLLTARDGWSFTASQNDMWQNLLTLNSFLIELSSRYHSEVPQLLLQLYKARHNLPNLILIGFDSDLWGHLMVLSNIFMGFCA